MIKKLDQLLKDLKEMSPEREIPDTPENVIENFLSTLTPREERVMRAYYQNGVKEIDIRKQEINFVTGNRISKERLRQIRAKALRKLRYRILKVTGETDLGTADRNYLV
jgi:DNA-directed RNA polymerase sigma subunit (sigma70/sigma32)